MATADKLREPEPLTPEHELSEFDCGRDNMNTWLRKHALANDNKTSRTFVVQHENKVVAYYSLAAGSVERNALSKKLQKNSPENIPVIILGRLAVDTDYQGQAIGSSLLRDALLRSMNAADNIGVRALLVHALDEHLIPYYEKRGFQSSPLDPMTMFIPLEQARRLLEDI